MDVLSYLWSTYLLPALDILLIAYVFYRLLLLIKGTHVVQLIMGLVILMVATLLTRDVLHLQASSWLLQNLWAGALILLAVVFQPELRAALAHLGSRPLGHFFIPHQ